MIIMWDYSDLWLQPLQPKLQLRTAYSKGTATRTMPEILQHVKVLPEYRVYVQCTIDCVTLITKYEYIAPAECVKELIYPEAIIDELIDTEIKINLYVDNKTAITIIKNGELNRRSISMCKISF